jgi:hypothetical protein
MGHLVGTCSQEHDVEMIWRRRSSVQELPLTQRDVQVMFDTLFDIKWFAARIWAELTGEDDGDDEP